MSLKKNKNGGLVYSSGQGRMCPGCSKPVSGCLCQKKKPSPKGDGVVRVQRETKGRKGKGVTLITGVPLEGEELKKFSQELKKKCGCGGTLKDGVIEIQGDQRDLLIEELKKHGWTVKRAGG